MIECQKIKITISKKARHQFYQVMDSFNETFYLTDEINWNYTKLVSDMAFDDIGKFYKPKHYVDNEYVEATNFEELIKGTSP
ncbi:TPA: hypothetical protein KON27_000027 [Clostridioides difficile]|uniref:hypothetical protein n=1 Tax=Clostridioides difficile TaxID=1496 RepID=UPI00190EBBF6|nr:hypothetical protein [Clostridioides difficile]